MAISTAVLQTSLTEGTEPTRGSYEPSGLSLLRRGLTWAYMRIRVVALVPRALVFRCHGASCSAKRTARVNGDQYQTQVSFTRYRQNVTGSLGHRQSECQWIGGCISRLGRSVTSKTGSTEETRSWIGLCSLHPVRRCSLRSNIAAMAGTLNDITSEVVCMPDSDAFAVCYAVWVIW